MLHPCVCRTKLYLRYVDDCFTIFNNENFFSDFLGILDSQHNNIKFTMESALQCISFLNVCINIYNENVDTWMA